MTAAENKTRALDLLARLNDHDADAITGFTSKPEIVGSAQGLLAAFPDLEVEVRWVAAEDDMVVVYHDVRGTQQGPWLFLREPTGRRVETSFTLAFKFDEDGQIVDQWLGSNFIEMLMQLGWGFAPVGEVVPEPGG